ncbi:metal ABC transporter solute-binding protein, Zn/Mn family [Alkalihalobacillus sp. BA299]|uniref:metal ABC transporter solute-binding protein, Zn/Mn family n=1 Tax=Alkalihalobacillus sp. BA299 TaxID=2815938 RepID=UPI001ADA838E|nr:zinc ABC transporter substrate-binding protein [Alkalihalobacillus sp. BA299]
MFKKKSFIYGVFVTCALLVGVGCSNGATTSTEEGENGTIDVVTTIAQIAEPLSVIGGDRIEVESLMGPSVDPHLYNPTQGDIATIEGADLIFYNGLNLEANMVEIFDSIAESKPVLAIGETLPKDELLEEELGVVDPHVWFDIDLWKLALASAVEELKEYSPSDAEYFEENKQAYFAELDEINAEATEKLANIPEKQRIIVTAHDAFGYFGNKFSMEVVGLQGLSTEDEIGVSDINETISIIKEYKIPAIFVESSIDDRTIKSVIEGAASDGVTVELGGELFSDAMGEAGTDEGTYIGMYRHNVETIYNALSKGVE